MPIPSDPFLSQQWHLINPTTGLLDLNVLGVWNPLEGPAYTGAGIWTVVIDDGFDYTHSDFDNYSQALDFDFVGANDYDPFGLSSDAHGTAVTGIIGAAADGTGAVGVSFDASLIGYRVENLISDAWLVSIAEAIHHGALTALAHTINISQGIANDAESEFGFGYAAARFDDIETSISEAVDQGRNGLGTIIVKSAGNSRTDNYDVNSDDWTNDTRQVVVAAVDQNGFVSSYSSYGSALLISAFGTPGQVFTTDRVGAAGYELGDFTSGFNGTSSAAPMVTGVVNLMLDANSGLGWRDVQSILAASGRHVGTDVGSGIGGAERFAWGFNAARTWNGGGMHYSNDYGFGLVDAFAAVRLAETWLLTGADAAQVSNNGFVTTRDLLNATVVISDATTQNFVGNVSFEDEVERVTVTVTFSTSYMGDVDIWVTSPDGTVSQLINDQAGSMDWNGAWTFETQAFRGEYAGGDWTVSIRDDAAGDILTVSDIVLTVYANIYYDDRYIFTDEYSQYVGLYGHTNAINDTNSGSDEVNASALTTSSTIRLDGVAGLIDGVPTTFANVEDAIGGEAGDFIYGNTGSNQLFGMRGNDSLYGGDGSDILDGGTGNDYLDGGAGVTNLLRGGIGNDSYVVRMSSDTLEEGFGQGTADRVFATTHFALGADDYIEILSTLSSAGTSAINLTGNTLSQQIIGNAGINTLDGGGGTDTLNGGAGNDSYIVRSAADVISETAGQGTADRVFAAVSFVLDGSDDIEFLQTLSSAGTGAINLTGNLLSQTLTGNSGINTLDGGGGTDTLNGGAGNDSYIVRSTADVISETAGQGTADRVFAAVNFVLHISDDVEILSTLSSAGTVAQNLTGNVLSQQIIGNAGVNTLDGGGGGDMLTGGAGNDSYIVRSSTDVIVEGVGQGTADRVFAAVSFALAADDNIEILSTLSLGGAVAQNLTGNALAQQVIGNAGVNTLDGGGGGDTLTGGAGNDSYIVRSGANVIVEGVGQGSADRVFAAVNFTLAADDNIEILSTLSTGGVVAQNLTGNALAQQVVGNAGINTLDGGAGNDILTGGGGADHFVFSTALGAGNVDDITDFVANVDVCAMDNAIFTGLGLATGPLALAAFRSNGTGLAGDSSDRIIYNSVNGDLMYDADGTGAAAGIRFATLASGLVLDNNDFRVI